jgi:hypothetical protein
MLTRFPDTLYFLSLSSMSSSSFEGRSWPAFIFYDIQKHIHNSVWDLWHSLIRPELQFFLANFCRSNSFHLFSPDGQQSSEKQVHSLFIFNWILSSFIHLFPRRLWFDNELAGTEKAGLLEQLSRHHIRDTFFTPILSAKTCYSHTDLDHLDAEADIAHSYLSIHIMIRWILTFTYTHCETAIAIRFADLGRFKLDCICSECLGWCRLHHAYQWSEVTQEAEIRDNAGVKIKNQKQNMTCFDLDWLWSHCRSPSRQDVSHRVESVFRFSAGQA